MCNCNTISVCDQCSQGNPCGCPPDYSILPLQVPCTCCPEGYTYNATTSQCEGSGRAVEPIPCPACADSISSDCVLLPPIPGIGLTVSTTLTQFANYLNSVNFIASILTKIGLNNTTLGVDFCELVQACPLSSSTMPIIVYVTFSVP